MIRNRLLLKSFAVFFIIEMVASTMAPSISWALTAGPTTPEATSFEPVDTTDLVDLKTGDFVYNVPLLEVPGPAGSYPLSLSYHAGIQPDQEASWTGLGFTLNPGSIFRLVNGYPDDHENVTDVERSFWKGGTRETKTIGISYGIANAASVSAGLTFAQDTYKGRGIGGYFGLGFGYQAGMLNIGAHETVGISPYGDAYGSAGIDVGIAVGNDDVRATAGIGLDYNFDSGLSVGANAGVGVPMKGANGKDFGDNGTFSLLGASIGSDGSKPSLSVGGGNAGVYNERANHVSTNTSNFQVDIPVYYGLSVRLGRNYQRYWIDETKSTQTNGSLYSPLITTDFEAAFDTYNLLDLNLDIATHNDSEKVLGGGLPDVDQYTVTAQGLSGNIKPYYFQKYLNNQQDKKDESNKVLSKNYSLSTTLMEKPIQFGFINDFSNRIEYNPNGFDISSDKISFDYKGNIITGENGTDGYNRQENHLAGSKHIEWYTNVEILKGNIKVNPFAEGFVDCHAEGFLRESDSQIGGYSITNSSGVTYHYALPVYSYDEYMKSVNSSTKQITDGERWNELKKPKKYAYTWLLTAVTGPDYVDRNKNGLADHDDWGYWVDFEYKKWLNDYKWRNPGEGTNRDLDGDFENFSAGRKEIYYLDKIITQSHVAIFEKSQRIDGREVSDLRIGGFGPTPFTKSGQQTCISECLAQCSENCAAVCDQECEGLPGDVISYASPRPSLKLDRIKLYNYSDFIASHLSESYTLREIEFDYDYSLAKGTPNSYNEETLSATGGKPILEGKLTLNKLSFLGKKGTPVIPPLTFGYKNTDYKKDFVDVWGFYKSDFDVDFRDKTNNIIGRLTTDKSALDVDAWSLNEIGTSLGTTIKIQYESDQYNNVVLQSQQLLRTNEIIDYAPDKLKINFWEEVDLSKYLTEGQSIDLDLQGIYSANGHFFQGGDPDYSTRDCNCGAPDFQIFQPKTFTGKGVIETVDVENGFIIVNAPEYYDLIKNQEKTEKYFGKLTDDQLQAYPTCTGIYTCNFSWSGAKAYPKYFASGSVSFTRGEVPGGGLRVKSLTLQETLGGGRITSYQYENGTTAQEPYEILSVKINPDYLNALPSHQAPGTAFAFKRAILNKLARQIGISRQLPGPGVMYQYVTVKETNITPDKMEHPLPNSSKYEFEMYQNGMVDIDYGDVVKEPVVGKVDVQINGSISKLNFKNAYHNQIVLKDFSSRVGNFKSVTLFNSDTNEPISKTTNNYLHDDLNGSFDDNKTKYEDALKLKYTNQGLREETFAAARIVFYGALSIRPYPQQDENFFYEQEERNLLATISKLESFPSVPTGQTNINYKTGMKNESKNLAFDFYSGESTQALTSDSYGSKYLSVTVPAYKNYSGMGLKVTDKANRNMLTQASEQYSYVVDDNNTPEGLLSASIQTWSDQTSVLNQDAQSNIWRARSGYQWNGPLDLNPDGSYPYDPSLNFANHPFKNWDNTDPGELWLKTGELTLYDVYSHGLEAKDVNANYASTKMNKDQSKVIVSATNSRYAEMAYSGAEYYAGNTEKDGDVARGQGNASPAHVHTGQYSLLVGSGNKGFNFTVTPANADNKKYRASVWVYLPGQAETQGDLDKLELYYSINNQEKSISPKLQKNKSKSWYLLNLDITPIGKDPIYIGVRNGTQRGAYFDDFRVHPLNAALTSYVYDPLSGELVFILDANNFYTRFEYDAMGRLIRSSKELLNFDFGDGKESYHADIILKETKYNYGKGH